MLKKVISGGQVGSDLAGLRAAQAVGLETGGWCPAGWKTLLGPAPELADFGLKEHYSDRYPPRTEGNVFESDGTLRLALDFMSPGERCTMKYIMKHDKPWADVQIFDGIPPEIKANPEEVAEWILEEEIEVLNVAGNGKEEIENCVQEFLEEVFRRAKG